MAGNLHSSQVARKGNIVGDGSKVLNEIILKQY